MEQDFLFAGRIFSFVAPRKGHDLLMRRLMHLMRQCRAEITPFLDDYSIPPVVQVTFKQGDGSLEGMYHVGGKVISESIISFDLYTKPFDTLFSHHPHERDYELLDTFIHELIHHRVRNEKRTQKLTKRFMQRVKDQL